MTDSGGFATELLTIQELSQTLKISRVTAYRMVEHRDIPFCKVRGALRFMRRDIEAYLLQTRIESKNEWK